jgi:threonine aldolase
VCLENTSNRGGGSCYDLDEIKKIKQVCEQNGLALHLDGARLWNAMIAKNETSKQYGEIFNSISICLSKGLGAPAGSVLVGKKSFIKRARRTRKVFGGGMRQAGYLAAAGIYALKNHFERLQKDHHHAKQIGEAILKSKIASSVLPVETNIVIFETKEPNSAAKITEQLKQKEILCSTISPGRVRFVLHLDIFEEMVNKTIDVIRDMK